LTVPTIDADAWAKALLGIAASDTRIRIALTHRTMMLFLLDGANRCLVKVNGIRLTIRASVLDARPKMTCLLEFRGPQSRRLEIRSASREARDRKL
jgi:hypothetical protein